MHRITAIALAVGVVGGAAWAEGSALVIGNGTVDRFQTFFGGSRILDAADALGSRNVAVTLAQNADSDAMFAAFADFTNALERDEPVVVLLSGTFVHGPAGTMLLPVADEDDGEAIVANALLRAFPVDAALTVLAAYPGKALLLLGEASEGEPIGPFLEPGIGRLDVPHGVTVIRGPAQDVGRFATRILPLTGRRILITAEQSELIVEGFAPRDFVLFARPDSAQTASPMPVAEPQAPAEPEPDLRDITRETNAWAAAQNTDTAEGYRAFLQDFPEGENAPAARQRLAAIEAEPFYAERRAEERLELGRDARRDIQRDLSILGYDPRGIDGIFGRGSRAAIAEWQRDNGFAPSGYVSRDQRVALDAQAERRAVQLEAEARERQAQIEREDRLYWQNTGRGTDEAGLRAYLSRYPEGLFADEARAELRRIEDQRATQAAERDRQAWDAARSSDTADAYRAYLDTFPSGAFADTARARIDELTRNSQREEIVARARAEEERLNLNPVARRLAEARLQQLGLNPGDVDGKFDRDTRRAIRRFQEARDLQVTGFLDQDTVVRLLAGGIIRR
ncbi:peptidoglycan-binding protein [Thalassococcus sp. CAU 1522]|uniref:Peptidoglycan-binding protein n=1 Tax=Thalassococcus arenae TaxID=2851652 RepID=A0ABS6N986_9RHOB|nr:peptidoglycan-binding domain-containing protein [Thalassococcus arenae]MBV2360120.1 peptidoglycan-binding protein [Thalassococcus arenae]